MKSRQRVCSVKKTGNSIAKPPADFECTNGGTDIHKLFRRTAFEWQECAGESR